MYPAIAAMQVGHDEALRSFVHLAGFKHSAFQGLDGRVREVGGRLRSFKHEGCEDVVHLESVGSGSAGLVRRASKSFSRWRDGAREWSTFTTLSRMPR